MLIRILFDKSTVKRRAFPLSIVLVLFILLVYPLPENGSATIKSSECEGCHGLYPGIEKIAPSTACVDCHKSSENDSITTLGGQRVPVVFNTTPPISPLAGGNFHYVAEGFGDRKGHNVDGIVPLDREYGGAPPGYDRASDPSVIGYDPGMPLTCSGANGCHGNRDVRDPFKAILGTHHSADSPLDGSTTAKSYRYLKITDAVKGVLGLEDDDWGQTASSKDHNEHSPTINALCVSCHGDLHGRENTGERAPWFGHPSGIVIPGIGEYAGYKTYRLEAPVARDPVPASASDVVSPGSDQVTCLSCHLAHSGPYDSILRWDYDAMVAGETEGGGCFICHTEK